MLRVGFEPTPFRTRTLIWRLRPTRPSQRLVNSFFGYYIYTFYYFTHLRQHLAAILAVGGFLGATKMEPATLTAFTKPCIPMRLPDFKARQNTTNLRLLVCSDLIWQFTNAFNQMPVYIGAKEDTGGMSQEDGSLSHGGSWCVALVRRSPFLPVHASASSNA
jgi:hypothetical protein